MPRNDDPICNVCQEPRSVHVATKTGPLTHPREARGEGVYVLDRAGFTLSGAMGRFPGGDDEYVPPTYKFVPHARPRDEWDDKWRPSD